MTNKHEELLRPQSADGIKEFDNDMPGWWVKLFWLTGILGVAYVVYLYGFGGQTLIQAYNQGVEYQEWQLQQAASRSEAGGGDDSQLEGTLAERLASAAFRDDGKAIYGANCVACHGADGGGTIGPNLTDSYWLHGNKPDDIVKVIAQGVPEKGMVAWQPVLGRKKVEQVAAYVISLIGTKPANPKAPQGDLIEE